MSVSSAISSGGGDIQGATGGSMDEANSYGSTIGAKRSRDRNVTFGNSNNNTALYVLAGVAVLYFVLKGKK